MCLVDNIFYNFVHIKNEDVDVMIFNYGSYAGRIIYIVVLIALFCCIPFIKSWNRVMARIERDEYEGARDRLKKLLHFSMLLIIPVTVFVFTSAETIQIAVFKKPNAVIADIQSLSAFMILFIAVAVFLSWLLNHMGKSLLFVVNLSIAWAVHIALLVLMVLILKKDLLGILIAEEAAFAVYDLLCTFMLFKMLKYRHDIIRNAGIPTLSAAVAGLILLFTNKLFANLIGEVLTLLVGILIYTVVYFIVLILLKGITTEELERVPLGRLLMRFSHSVQHDDFYEE
jgi:O-antigen/teichoic acid export membrane protein